MDEIMNMKPAAERADGETVKKPELPVNRERLQEFDKILSKYKAGKANLEKRVVAAEQWWKLRNDAQARKEYDVGWDRDFQSRSGWLHNVLVSKHADAMENYPEAIILPREESDKAQAKMLSSVIPCILEETDFESTYASAWWRKLKTGTAVYKCSWDPTALNWLGEISIRDVDLLSVFWEPGVRDIQDSRYFFHVELHDNDLLEEEYPQLKDRLKGSKITLTKYVYDDNVSTDGKSAVIDVYYKQRGVLHYCKYVGDQVLYSTENEEADTGNTLGVYGPGLPEQKPGGGSLDSLGMAGTPGAGMTGTMPAIATPSMQTGTMHAPGAMPGAMPGMTGAGMPGAMEPEHKGLYDDGMYPFVFDPLFPIEGSPCGYGYVDLCKNSQTTIDELRTAFVKNVKVGATPRYFSRSDGAINEGELLDLTKPVVHVNGPVDEQFLRVIDKTSLPGSYQNVYNAIITELRETSGNTESANGVYGSGVTAASSIAALQEASGKTSRDSSRASYRSFRRLVTMIIERIRQFYDMPRQFRIMGQNGQEQFVAFDNAAMRPQPVGLGGTDFGFTQPVFDVRIEVQKRNAYTRTSQNELALQLYQLGVFTPGAEGPALMLLDMMDFDGRDELTRKLQERQMMMQMMAAAVPAPAPGEADASLESPGQKQSETHLAKSREQAREAAST